jgi:hypothetical protein
MRSTRDTTTNIKEMLGVNAGQVINKNEGAWDSFFKQPGLKMQEKLPPFIENKKLSPPGYWKERDTGEKETDRWKKVICCGIKIL